MKYTPRSRRSHQYGLTLVELMVGLLLTLLVALAASGALLASRQSFSTVDAASQLRDNGRFASRLIERVLEQTGYQDHSTEGVRSNGSHFGASTSELFLEGYDNVGVTVPSTGPDFKDGGGVNGSDALVVRYQGSSMANLNTGTPDAADGSVIDCKGAPQPKTTGKMSSSIIYVKTGTDGEPSLMCAAYDTEKQQWDTPVPLIQGVETLQVRYGADSPNLPAGTPTTDLPQIYKQASDLNAGDAAQRKLNWQRVKAVRIGMVMRGPAGSGADRSAKAIAQIFPLGSTMHSSDDAGSEFTPTKDGRLRQVVTFTVYLRNPQTW